MFRWTMFHFALIAKEDGPLDMRNPWDPPEDPSQAQDMQDD